MQKGRQKVMALTFSLNNLKFHLLLEGTVMWFISVKLVVLANTPDSQKPTTEILYYKQSCVHGLMYFIVERSRRSHRLYS